MFIISQNVGQIRMFKEMVAIAVVVWIMQLLPSTQADVCARYSNGCNIPGYVPPAYKGQFTASCYRHDVCYYCGRAMRIPRRWCDVWFYYNMRRTCNWWQFSCKYASYLYYYAARIGGSSHYNSVSPSWCSQSWAGRCIY